MAYDYLIVGAGFTGATCARVLAEAGKRVLIIDKRDHIGGNAYDYVNEHGVRIHKYGPHIFHTNSDKVFDWLSRFTEWRPYEHRVLASVEGKLVPFPINLTTLEMLGLTREECAPDESITHPQNAEEQCLQRVGRTLYEMFFEGYTTKMWGKHPRELDASVTARIPVRWDSRDDRYFTDKHQAMPKDGYAALFERMLDHPGIEVRLGAPAPRHPSPMRDRSPYYGAVSPLIWTGPIDEYFGRCLGPLPYRSMRFEHFVGSFGDGGFSRAATTNYPALGSGTGGLSDMTRMTNMTALGGIDGRLAPGCGCSEYPQAEGEPYYPIPAPENHALYDRYRELAAREKNVTFLGRLGRYQYINMDQAVGQALVAAERLLGANPSRI